MDDEKTEEVIAEVAVKENKKKTWYPTNGETSFAEIDELEKTTKLAWEVEDNSQALIGLVGNVLNADADPVQKTSMLSNLVDEFKGRVAGIFSNMKEAMQPVMETKEISFGDSFHLLKSADGLHWIATYSNNLRDDDYPPEIISKESHARFVKMVEAGKAELPELWVWHSADLKVGQATWVGYDEESNSAMAAGYIDKDKEDFVMKLADAVEPMGLSHGMPIESVKYDKDDGSIIVEHVTEEISILPLAKAANKWTELHVIKEATMPFDANKKAQLMNAVPTLTDEMLEGIQAVNSEKAKLADELQIERKEATEEVADVVTEEVVIEEPVVEVEAEVEAEVEDDPDASNFTAEQQAELVEIINASNQAITKNVVASVGEMLAPLMEGVEEINKGEDARLKERVEKMSKSSLTDVILGNIQKHSAVQDGDNVLDGRSAEAKMKPKETEAGDDVPNITGSEFDVVLSKLFNSPVSQ